MNGARAEVSQYVRVLECPTTVVETAMIRTEQHELLPHDPDQEAFQLLKLEREALAEAWRLLEADLKSDNKHGNTLGPVPETFESVIREAQNAQKEMNERKRFGGGKPKDYYNKFCQNAHQHRTVFDIFPSSNEYTEIFCGSIRTLVKVSVNYIQISEGLSRALDEITELADFSKREADMITNQYTKRGLARLYKEIFLYLKDCIKWFTGKSRTRALKSFNEDFYKCFEDRMQCIKDVASNIHQEAMIGGMQVLQTRLASTEDLEQRRRRRFEQEMAEWKFEMQQLKEPLFQQKVLEEFGGRVMKILERESGLRAKYMLEDIYRSDEWERSQERRLQPQQTSSATSTSSENQVLFTQQVSEAASPNGRNYKRSEVWDNSKGLESFILGNSVDLLNTLHPSPFASAPVAMKLREWLESRVSTTLWIRGTPVSHYPNELSALAGSLVNAATASKTPILFHFCEPVRSNDMIPGFTAEQCGAVSLAFSLIRQLILLLEPDFNTSVDFGQARFLLLEKPLKNWKDVLELLEALFDLSPGVLLCVIDGMDYLDYGPGQPMCTDILDVLKRRKLSSDTQGFVLKALFTSAGVSMTLDKTLGLDEVVIDEEPQHRGSGKPGPGQKLIFGEDM